MGALARALAGAPGGHARAAEPRLHGARRPGRAAARAASTTATSPTRSSGTTPRPSRTGSASPPSPASCRRPASRARRWSSPPSPRPCRTRAEAPPGAKSSGGATRVHVELLKVGSRGPAVARVQRALGIPRRRGSSGRRPSGRCARSRSATACSPTASSGRGRARRSSPRSPKPKRAQKAKQRFIRAWWVVPVQRTLGVPADGALRAGHAPGRARVPEAEGPRSSTASSGRRRSARSASGAARLPQQHRRPPGGSRPSSTRGARVASMSRRYLGIRVPLGRVVALERLRLLRLRHVPLPQGRRLAPAQRGHAVPLRAGRPAQQPPRRRPRLLQRPRARRDLPPAAAGSSTRRARAAT